jgi:hypothetical protein
VADASTIISNCLNLYDNVTATDAQNTTRRARLLVYLQHVYSYVFALREWQWVFMETPFTIAAQANSAPLSVLTSFMRFGRNGSIFDTDRRIRMREKTRYIEQRTKQQLGGTGFNYPFFAITGGNIQIPYTSSSILNLVGYYVRKPEVLTDTAAALLIPDPYGDTVLLPGLAFRAQESKQDARETWKNQFRDGISEMLMIENPSQTATRRLPLAVRGAW